MSKMLKCWVCGKEHDYCPTCGQTNGWRYVADTPKCYQIYITINEFQSGVKEQKDAVETLANLDVYPENDLSWLRPHIEKQVREIIGDKEKTTKTTRKTNIKSKLFE